jgi:hypothetical protein
MIALVSYGGTPMRRRNRVPGCIFINHGRYWWRVKLPGEEKLRALPLVSGGGHGLADGVAATAGEV